MKFNKQLAIILVLLSMLLSAIAVSVYFYNQIKKAERNNNQLVKIFVANKDIKKGTLITQDYIKTTTIARQYVLTKPMLMNEILNKYANEPIYKNEPFLKEKLSKELKKEVIKKDILDYKYNSYNMQMKLFKNPNFSLKPNDIIKIISVYKTQNTDIPQGTPSYTVRYVAKNIRVLGFLMDGKPSSKSIIKTKIKRKVKNKQVEEIVDSKADEIVLDIKQTTLISLIRDYNKGEQLWMVKSKIDDSADKEKEKKRLAEMLKKQRVKKVASHKKIYYPVKFYKPKNTTSTKTATITYANNKSLKDTKTVNIHSNFDMECSKTDKLLIVVANKTYLRSNPSYKAKIVSPVYKNYVISFKSASKINPNWYQVCDGSYINSEKVTEIDYEEYKKLK